MTIANTVTFALQLTDVDFQVLKHPHTSSSAETARRADVDAERLAKAIVYKDHCGYLLAVVASTRDVDLKRLRETLHRPGLDMVSEDELDGIFYDCEKGAIPPLGPEYRVPTVIDVSLKEHGDVYFEAGDHEELIHVSRTSFDTLMQGAEYMEFSRPHG